MQWSVSDQNAFWLAYAHFWDGQYDECFHSMEEVSLLLSLHMHVQHMFECVVGVHVRHKDVVVVTCCSNMQAAPPSMHHLHCPGHLA